MNAPTPDPSAARPALPASPTHTRFAWLWTLACGVLLCGACQGPSDKAAQPCRPLPMRSLFSDSQAVAWTKVVSRSLAHQQYNRRNRIAAQHATGYVFRRFLTADTARLYRERVELFHDLRKILPYWEGAHPCAVYVLERELIGEGASTTYVLLVQPSGGEYYTFKMMNGQWLLTQQGSLSSGAQFAGLDALLAAGNRCSAPYDPFKEWLLVSRFTVEQGWVALAAANTCEDAQKTYAELLAILAEQHSRGA